MNCKLSWLYLRVAADRWGRLVVRDNSGRFVGLMMVSEVFDYCVGGRMDAWMQRWFMVVARGAYGDGFGLLELRMTRPGRCLQ